jgi:hypothetical protein
MPLSLSCPCGTTFDVEDTFAGQTVSCPECQASVKVPAVADGPRRTSGFAIASLVLALAGAFTLVGTLAAVLCGLAGLVSIGRSRGRLAGAGLAVFGMVLGVLFTGLTVLGVLKGELFGFGDQFRKYLLDGQVDFSGPAEVVRPHEGFKITRPSDKWGLAKPDFVKEQNERSLLMLVNTGKDAYVDVEGLGSTGQTLDQLRQEVVQSFRDQEAGAGRQPALRDVKDVAVRDNRRLPDRDGAEVGEVILDVRVLNQPLTYLIQVVKERRPFGRAFVVRGWTSRRRFAQTEDELREAVESFRILPPS